jgi:hypothetical protein
MRIYVRWIVGMVATEGRSPWRGCARNLHDPDDGAELSLCADPQPHAVMLAQEDWAPWLGTAEDRKAILIHATFPAERMERWPVGKAVGNVRNEGAQLIERIAA